MYDAFCPNAFLSMPVISLFFFLTAALKRTIWWPEISFFQLLLLLLVLSLPVVFWFCSLYSVPVSVWLLSFLYFLTSRCCSCYAVVDLYMWRRTSQSSKQIGVECILWGDGESQKNDKLDRNFESDSNFCGVVWGCLSECWGLLLGSTCLNAPLPLLYSSAGWNTYCVEMLYIFKLM